MYATMACLGFWKSGPYKQKMLFFALLPTDLQIDVFQTWIGCADDGLKALSAMDTACCCKSLRSPFLSLTACVHQGCHVKESLTKLMANNRLQWFLSRSIQIKELTVYGTEPPTAPLVFRTVEVLTYAPKGGSPDEFATILQACSTLRALHMDFHRVDAACKLDKVWMDLTTCEPDAFPMLHEFHFSNWTTPCDVSIVRAAMQRIGKELVTLVFMDSEIDGNLLLQALAESCHRLRKVQLSAPNGTVDGVIGLMVANRELREITLSGLNCTSQDILSILVATEPHQKLKSFCCNGCTIPFDSNVDCFVHAIARFPSLDVLSIQDCLFSRAKRSLKLYRTPSHHEPSWQRLFAVEPPIRELSLYQRAVNDSTAEWIGQRVGSNLTILHCRLSDGLYSCQLLAHCTQLMELTTFTPIDDEFLLLVAKTCKQLRFLDCFGAIADRIATDHGVEALFANCRLLIEVRLGKCVITVRSLQAILDNKLRLKMLSFTSDYINAGDIERFKISAKELQLLPVPQIVK